VTGACLPEHFDVTYSINPWMDPGKPVDRPLAMLQWQRIRQLFTELGHEVEVIPARPGLPDMVFAANGATVAGVFGETWFPTACTWCSRP
jgi:N-dimethylarginine dimethylaminohydrolase